MELEAESQVEVAQLMEDRGQVVVGWYHSHPVFEARPSQKGERRASCGLPVAVRCVGACGTSSARPSLPQGCCCCCVSCSARAWPSQPAACRCSTHLPNHPPFPAADNENQRNYQALYRDPSSGLEPWVGAIVGPYHQGLESPVSKGPRPAGAPCCVADASSWVWSQPVKCWCLGMPVASVSRVWAGGRSIQPPLAGS